MSLELSHVPEYAMPWLEELTNKVQGELDAQRKK
jgi:hypothetical protein